MPRHGDVYLLTRTWRWTTRHRLRRCRGCQSDGGMGCAGWPANHARSGVGSQDRDEARPPCRWRDQSRRRRTRPRATSNRAMSTKQPAGLKASRTVDLERAGLARCSQAGSSAGPGAGRLAPLARVYFIHIHLARTSHRQPAARHHILPALAAIDSIQCEAHCTFTPGNAARPPAILQPSRHALLIGPPTLQALLPLATRPPCQGRDELSVDIPE